MTTDLAYDVCMRKRRLALDLDADIVEAADLGMGRMSAIANAALRKAVEEKKAHHRALLEWLDELDAEYGAPTEEDAVYARAAFEELHRDDPREGGSA